MAGLTESPTWEAEIYQIETTDPVVGGPPNLAQGQGIANAPQQQLANRTAWLKAQIETLGLDKVDVSELDARIDALLNGAPAAMDTLKELSDAIAGNDDEIAALVGQVSSKLNASAFTAAAILALLANQQIASGTAWIENGVIAWKGGKHRISNNDGSGNAQVRFGHDGDENFTDEGTAFYLGGAVDSPNSEFQIRVAENGGAGTGQPVSWGEVFRVFANDVRYASRTLVTPAGLVAAFAANSPPYGWLECNGAAVSRSAYATLFASIGTTFGNGNGSTTFNLPDLRGEFLRGWDNGRGADSGRVLGSSQSHALQHHLHNYLRPLSKSDTDRGTGGGSLWSIDENQTGVTGGISTGNSANETRPRNVALMFCIRY